MAHLSELPVLPPHSNNVVLMMPHGYWGRCLLPCMGPEHEPANTCRKQGPVPEYWRLEKACPAESKPEASWDPTVGLHSCVTENRSLLNFLSQAFILGKASS